MASLHQLLTPHAKAAMRFQALTHTSSMREKVFEHLLLAQLGMELMARGVEFEVLHGETDRDGHDLILEAGGMLRHVQLKATIVGGARGEVTINTRLASKPAACVVWLTVDSATRSFESIRWFGNLPGAPLPDLGSKVARHSRANAQGIKNHREGHRVLPVSRFERLADIAHLADKLFGALPAEPLAFLQSRLHRDVSGEPAWLGNVADGDFTAIPSYICWADGLALAQLIDGYRLLELLGGGDPVAFLNQQRAYQQIKGVWAGDARQLWITLFLEARADRFGANDASDATPHLNLLCRQMREALIAMETADA